MFFLSHLDTIYDLYNYTNPEINKRCPMVSDETFNIVQANKEARINDKF